MSAADAGKVRGMADDEDFQTADRDAHAAAVARDAAQRAARDGLPDELSDQDRPAMGEWSAQTTQQTDVAMRPGDDGDGVTDIAEALGENEPWDPPDRPQS